MLPVMARIEKSALPNAICPLTHNRHMVHFGNDCVNSACRACIPDGAWLLQMFVGARIHTHPSPCGPVGSLIALRMLLQAQPEVYCTVWVQVQVQLSLLPTKQYMACATCTCLCM
jgi:hypothetical protein